MSVSVLSLGPDAQRQVAEKLAQQQAKAAAEKRPKHGNRTVVVDGYRFDSQGESLRYLELVGMQRRGEIGELRVQPAWRIEIGGELICDYVADFAYVLNPTNLAKRRPIVEDFKSKSTKTREYRIKRKLMRAVHHIDVQEIE